MSLEPLKRIDRKPGDGSWQVTKLQAAATELSRAMRVLMYEDDALSAHVLGSAALEIIDTLCRVAGKQTLRDLVMEHVKDEAKAAFRRLLNEEYNFFKHADRDHDAVNDVYNPGLTEMLLWEACVGIHQLIGKVTFDGLVYIEWYISNHPDLVLEDYAEKLGAMRALITAFYDGQGRMSRDTAIDLLRTLDENSKEMQPQLAAFGAKPPKE